MIIGRRSDITVNPGTNRTPDATDTETLHWVDTQNARFFNGKLRKDSGWDSVEFSNNQIILGCGRMLYGYRSINKDRLMIGTSTRLYVFQDGALYNISPLVTSTTAIANSLDTNYTTLATDPFTTVIGSRTVTIAHTAHKLFSGDSITISGAATTNGIPNTELNATHIVRSTTTNNYTIMVPTTAATSSGTGGGASVVEATAIITVNAAAHGFLSGDRVKITGATATGGIPALEINAEHIIRNVLTNTFDIVVLTKATSSVTGGGGAGTLMQGQIAEGVCDYSVGIGYGGGLYGVGLYGVAKLFVSAALYPRIWSGGRFGNDFIGTPGGGTGVYIWQNNTSIAATPLTNAPTQCNWVFIAHNAVVTLGDSGIGNRIKISDRGDATIWVPSASSLAYEDDIEGAGTFISSAQSKEIDLLFSETEVLILRYVGLPDIYATDTLLSSDGIIAPKARIEVEGAVFWMGSKDFYVYDGSGVSRLPNNTLYEYIYNNINYEQRWKIFCAPISKFNEIEFHIPLGTQNEPITVVKYNYKEQTWTLVGTRNRTAAEEPYNLLRTPYQLDAESETVAGTLYRHESGVDDDNSAMDFFAFTNFAKIGNGDSTMEIIGLVPDGTIEGNAEVTLYTKNAPYDANIRTFGPYSIDSTTELLTFRAQGRYRQYKFEQNSIGDEFIMAPWYELVEGGTPR